MTGSSPIHTIRPRCEHLRRPRGLNTDRPRFTWGLAGDGAAPKAWRIIAGPGLDDVEGGRGTLWDSGFQSVSETNSATWDGPALSSDMAFWWAVQVKDDADRVSGWSTPQQVFTGLGPKDWQADWIGRSFVPPGGMQPAGPSVYANDYQARPADYLRFQFDADQTRRAYVYVSALGLYELYLNGNRVGDEILAPGWTDYHTRVEYQSFDVTDLVADGSNTIGAILGEGWYSGRIGHNQRRAGNHYGGRPALLCQLHLEDDQGNIRVIASDATWQTRQGPICYSDFLVGEKYDARLNLADWTTNTGTDVGWQPVDVIDPKPRAPMLDAARADPVREVAYLDPVTVSTDETGEMIFDLGQNIAGYVTLDVEAPPGTEIRLRHAERLSSDGSLYTENLRYAVSEDIYICRGGGIEHYKPRFTFHGFQYVGVTSSAGLQHLAVRGVAIGSDLPVSGTIETGHKNVNTLISNIFWSQRDNFLAVPTDCPQRDERYGWSADAQVFWRTAGFNMDVAAFTEKWMRDLVDGQSESGVFPDVAPTKPLNPYRLTPQPGAPAWGDAPIILAWDHWSRYGDRHMMDTHWDAFVAWMDVIEDYNPDGVRCHFLNNNYGDWLSVGPETDRELINTAYWIRLADIMGHLAGSLEKDQTRWRALSHRLRSAFAARFLAEDGRLSGDTQTAYLLALDFDLLPPEARPRAASHLRRLLDAADGHLQTGFLGVRHVAPVVTDWLGPDAAIDLLLKDTYPSWGFSIRHGATTIWERWDGWTPEKGFQTSAMNSFNHYAYGAIGEWIWARLAGIDWDETAPGFRGLLMRPVFDRRIGRVNALYQAPSGDVQSSWEFVDSRTVSWHVSLPPGVSAKVELPPGFSSQNTRAFLLAPGHHSMSIQMTPD